MDEGIFYRYIRHGRSAGGGAAMIVKAKEQARVDIVLSREIHTMLVLSSFTVLTRTPLGIFVVG